MAPSEVEKLIEKPGYPTRVATVNKTNNNMCGGGCGESERFCAAGGNGGWSGVWEFLRRLNTATT